MKTFEEEIYPKILLIWLNLGLACLDCSSTLPFLKKPTLLASAPGRANSSTRCCVSVLFNQSPEYHKISHYHKIHALRRTFNKSIAKIAGNRKQDTLTSALPNVTDGAWQFVYGTIVRSNTRDIRWIMRNEYFYRVQQVDYRPIRLPCTTTSLQKLFSLQRRALGGGEARVRNEKRKRDKCRLKENNRILWHESSF